jgi:hypothetical protein
MAASTVSVTHLHNLNTLNDPVVMAADEPYNNNQTPNDDDTDCSSSSVDTNEAFLAMLGLSLDDRDEEEDALPNSTTPDEVIIVDEGEGMMDCRSIPLPRRCARYWNTNTSTNTINSNTTALVADSFLSPKDCHELIQLANVSHGFRYITEATHTAPDGSSLVVQIANPNPHKLAVFENPTIITHLWNAMQRLLLLVDSTFQATTTKWGPPVGLNPRLRILRYDATDDDRFDPHFDATTVVGNQTSRCTVLVYLNDGDGIDFEGGDTLFLDQPNTPTNTTTVTVTPQTGRVVLFDHDLFHASSPLVSGTKYVLRTDLLFDTTNEPTEDRNASADAAIDVTITTTTTVSDLCQELHTNMPPNHQQILQSMELFDMTLASFVAPGIPLLEAMLLDGGMDAATTTLLIQAALSRIPAT